MRFATILLVPAVTEELIFRGLLTPTRGESGHDPWWLLAGWAAFVVWHLVEALTFLPGAAYLFLRLDFLVCAGLLGAACALMRYRTGSLWPAVLLHGVTVFIWQTALGGPGFARLQAG
ncbi:MULTISPECIES: type II CAAX prenyl endopeptidase Rce1 family protein [Asticcacaulis]|uniref:CPBP family glutamic-type intramembrane protease n=1 Tax=Asticcacaulis TaxID=76890 RepID=UPI001AE17545|nr:CPBP family glutamic-type intramembrane protease [Asticcacaulis sp. BE141]MBP2160874.1 putative Abi (CAAX) family protease [Asticcacaulis solisilvae]MDR6801922.1 putative Abi (CAAX) family protease [Asticcacaulis sp. BE141]